MVKELGDSLFIISVGGNKAGVAIGRIEKKLKANES